MVNYKNILALEGKGEEWGGGSQGNTRSRGVSCGTFKNGKMGRNKFYIPCGYDTNIVDSKVLVHSSKWESVKGGKGTTEVPPRYAILTLFSLPTKMLRCFTLLGPRPVAMVLRRLLLGCIVRCCCW